MKYVKSLIFLVLFIYVTSRCIGDNPFEDDDSAGKESCSKREINMQEIYDIYMDTSQPVEKFWCCYVIDRSGDEEKRYCKPLFITDYKEGRIKEKYKEFICLDEEEEKEEEEEEEKEEEEKEEEKEKEKEKEKEDDKGGKDEKDDSRSNNSLYLKLAFTYIFVLINIIF